MKNTKKIAALLLCALMALSLLAGCSQSAQTDGEPVEHLRFVRHASDTD